VRTGVLGLGLIGGSLLKGLAAAGVEATGADADPGVAGAARAAGFDVAADASALARAADVVVVCVPPEAAAAAVVELLAADPEVTVADAASVKAPVLRDVAAGVPGDALGRFVGAHPLAGAESAGWESSDPALLRAAVWAVCPPAPDAPVTALSALAAALEPLDARLLVCDATEHDAAVARTSHVPHVAAQALARLPAGDGLPLAAALSAGAYRDMTRTARSDAALWLSILGANRTAAAAGLRALVSDLERLATAVEAGDDASLAAAWRDGAAARAAVDDIRWAEPDWQPRRVALPAWGELLDLGRAGMLVRRLRAQGDELALEAASPRTA
jgi:prephenate dehydrogenase